MADTHHDNTTVEVPEDNYLTIKYDGGVRTISPSELREMADSDDPVLVG